MEEIEQKCTDIKESFKKTEEMIESKLDKLIESKLDKYIKSSEMGMN